MSRTIQELQMLQALPLDVKVRKTQERIKEWVDEYGIDGVYVSFSGGKDSTVLLTIARELFPDMKAAYVDTGLEYPEIRSFVATWENVDWLKPKMNFRKVIEKYGYPFISKEISERVYYAQRYLTWYYAQNSLDRQTDRQTDRPPALYGLMDLFGVKRGSEEWKQMKQGNAPEWVLEQLAESNGKGSYKVRELLGKMTRADGSPTFFDYRRWKWLAFSPYMFSNKCCDVMKKSPAHSYMTKTGRKPIMGMMAAESKLRTQNWLHNGCNGFEMKNPVSNPMMFWTEQDALLYIRENKIPIASVYGDVITEDEESGQINLEEFGVKCSQKLKTTGCTRTGCVFCGFGCHLEKESRFVRLKETHPAIYKFIFKPWSEGGLGYKEVIDWLNEHGDLGIKY